MSTLYSISKKELVMCLFSILIFMIMSVLFSCTAPERPDSIEGLWVVHSVTVGSEEMTPNARWTRFHTDGTQESGNGRLQHSYGTWALAAESQELTIDNNNGLEDPYDPFVVTLVADRMNWERTEEGQQVKVSLKRATDLPETYGDRLLGLWQLENAVGDGPYFNSTLQDVAPASIHFRWDGRFVIRSVKGQVNGVFNAHGHRPEVELIPYGSDMSRDFWAISYEEDRIRLDLLNTDTTVSRTFKRIHAFID